MHGFFRETVFGRIVHYASGGRLFSMPEPRVILKTQKNIPTSLTSASGTVENTPADTPETQMADVEEANNFQLVDWEENDPEV
jgi:hypothetical protein